MKAYIRVFSKSDGLSIDGWEELVSFWCDDPILPLKGDGYRVEAETYTVTNIEHGYVPQPLDQGGVFDNILIYLE